ncbi:CRE-Potassium channel tetramerization-type BTB domain containing protein [Aphelenchoides avenae]|nr:CRE-Potassium channel tetramerization-type BTB domain containing protein [Aphelenchus avenae]
MWQPLELAKQIWPGQDRRVLIDTDECGLVKLMVDGKEFRTTAKTISAAKGSRLEEAIRTGAGCVQDPLGVVHIYYDPGLFSILLHYLRTGRLVLRGHTPQGILAAAEYWRLPGLAVLCQGRMDSERSATDAPSVVADNPGQALRKDPQRSSDSAADESPSVECGPLQELNEGQQRSSDSAADASPAVECLPLQAITEGQQCSGDSAAGASPGMDETLKQTEQAPHVFTTYATLCDIDARKAFRCEDLELMLFLEAAEQEDVAVLQQKLRLHPSMRSLKENGEQLDASDADAKRSLSAANSTCHLSRASEECISSMAVEKKKKKRGGRASAKRRMEAKKAGGNNDANKASAQCA